MNMNQIVEGVVLSKSCSIKPDGESNDTKTLTVKMDYNGLTLQDIFTKALSSDVIKWQASARKKFDSFTKGQIVEVSAKSPGATAQIDPETAMVARLQSMDTDEERAEYIKNVLLAKATK